MKGGQGKQARSGRTRQRRVIVRGTRRDPIDPHKLARALIALAQAQAEAEAQAEHEKAEPEPSEESHP